MPSQRSRAKGVTDLDANGAGNWILQRKAGRGVVTAPGGGSGGGFGGGGGFNDRGAAKFGEEIQIPDDVLRMARLHPPIPERLDVSTDRRNHAANEEVFDDLKKLVEANKTDDQPAGAVAPSNEPLAAVTETAEAITEAETSDADVALPLLTHLFMRAGRPLLTNEIAILIGQLIEADQIDVAKQLADELVIYLPEYEIGVKMRDAFANDELDEETRSTAVIELALKAQAELEAVMFRAWAEARLRNVLEASLYQTLVEASTDNTRDEKDDALLVSVLATTVDDDVLSALQEAGLTVKAKSGSFVVGETSADKLVDLALLQAVRRIEPARLTATPN